MPPITLLIKPASGLCNMRCKYCFYADVTAHREESSYGMMSEETLEALVIAALSEAEGSCSFVFQGGEPTLRGLPFYKTLAHLVRKHNQKRLRIHNAIQTNGLVIDDAWTEHFRAENYLVGISVDGDAAMHNENRLDAQEKGTHARVLRAADLLIRRGCQVNILCVVTERLARHGAKAYNFLKRYRYLQFIPCIDDFATEAQSTSLTAESYGRFLRTTFDLYASDYWRGEYVSIRAFDNYVHMMMGQPPENCAMQGVCSANLVVEADGSVYPCDFYVLDAHRLGNVRDQPLLSMQTSDAARNFVAPSLTPHAECVQCDYRGLCRGGCRRDCEGADGVLGRNRFCEAYRSFFEYSHVRMLEIARNELRQRR